LDEEEAFSVEQIVGVLKQAEVGVAVAEVIRKAGISEQILPLEGEVRWVGSRPGAPDDSVAEREPEAEAVGGGSNAGQDDAVGCALKKMVKPSRRGPMIDRLMSSYGASERHVCHVLCVTRGTYRYRSCLDPRTELRMRIREIAQARVRYGYGNIRVLLNREGWDVGKYLVYRLWTSDRWASHHREILPSVFSEAAISARWAHAQHDAIFKAVIGTLLLMIHDLVSAIVIFGFCMAWVRRMVRRAMQQRRVDKSLKSPSQGEESGFEPR
jgi:hypothetical protein